MCENITYFIKYFIKTITPLNFELKNRHFKLKSNSKIFLLILKMKSQYKIRILFFVIEILSKFEI